MAGVVAIASSVLLSACIDLPSLNRPDIPRGHPARRRGGAAAYIDINAPGRTADKMREWAEPISKSTGIPVVSLQAYGNAAEIQRQQHPPNAASRGRPSPESQVSRANTGTTVVPMSPPTATSARRSAGSSSTAPRAIWRSVTPMAAVSTATPPTIAPWGGRSSSSPETWKRYGVDASGGDGVPDPDNIDDAALSAARYLCVSSGNDMTVAEGWEKAIRRYNNSMAYVLDVRDHANAYSINVRF